MNEGERQGEKMEGLKRKEIIKDTAFAIVRCSGSNRFV